MREVPASAEHAIENRSIGGSTPLLGTIRFNDLATIKSRFETSFANSIAEFCKISFCSRSLFIERSYHSTCATFNPALWWRAGLCGACNRQGLRCFVAEGKFR
jgi:hypothetical protein